jgi:glutathione S-transferase
VWILRSAAASPFARKVRIGAALCGLTDRIEARAANTNDPEDPVRAENPLGKIPVLILEDGTALFDSRVILEFLDDAAGGGVIIPAGPARFPALTLQALGDGMMDAAVVLSLPRRLARFLRLEGSGLRGDETGLRRKEKARARARAFGVSCGSAADQNFTPMPPWIVLVEKSLSTGTPPRSNVLS